MHLLGHETFKGDQPPERVLGSDLESKLQCEIPNLTFFNIFVLIEVDKDADGINEEEGLVREQKT